MKTPELIAFLKSEDFKTTEQAYNLIVGDLFECCTEDEIRVAQAIIRYFNYKITEVLLPVIQSLRGIDEKSN